MNNNSWCLMIVVHLLTENDANVVEQILEKYKAKVARSASQNLKTFALYFSRVCSTTEASSSVSTCTTIIKTPTAIKSPPIPSRWCQSKPRKVNPCRKSENCVVLYSILDHLHKYKHTKFLAGNHDNAILDFLALI